MQIGVCRYELHTVFITRAAFVSVPAGTVPIMIDDTTEPPPLVRVRAVLDGSVRDGATVAVHGTLDAVTVTASAQSGQWAVRRLVDAEDSIEFMMFPRAFARTDRSSVETGGPITVTARVSISAQRTALVITSTERLEPRTESGVEHPVV